MLFCQKEAQPRLALKIINRFFQRFVRILIVDMCVVGTRSNSERRWQRNDTAGEWQSSRIESARRLRVQICSRITGNTTACQSRTGRLLFRTISGMFHLIYIKIRYILKDLDEFLLLACDGVYDVMSNSELCEFVQSRMLVTDDLAAVANQVLDACLSKGSRDNMSVVLVSFAGAPKVSEDAQKIDAQWKSSLETKVRCNNFVSLLYS